VGPAGVEVVPELLFLQLESNANTLSKKEKKRGLFIHERIEKRKV
jgi:hypothetical protein